MIRFLCKDNAEPPSEFGHIAGIFEGEITLIDANK